MIFEALPARFGDCLLLHVPDKGTVKRMLIDGGPGGVFADSLQPRLETLSGGRPEYRLDAVMVSHVDADHITGVLSLLDAIKDAKDRRDPPPYKVGQLIFNSFDRLATAESAELQGQGSVLSSMGGHGLSFGEHETDEVLASVAQGSRLNELARGLRIGVNKVAKPQNALLCVDGAAPTFRFGEAAVTVVGPRRPELDALRKAWDAWRQKKDRESLKALAAYADKSVPNLSSIVVWVTWGQRTLLLTGDARGDYILKGLEIAGLLPKGGGLGTPLDILKLPHHGSSRNVAPDFFERLPAKHYVASGDGWHGNPDRETLELLEGARPNGGYELHLTYPGDHLDREYKRYKAQHGKAWVPAKDAVEPVIERLRAAGVRVHTGPVRIDLR